MWASMLGDQVPHVQVEMALEDEHRRLFIQMDELQRQIASDAPLAKQRFTLQMLDSFLKANSLAEEAVMFASSFPGGLAHRDEHRAHHHAVCLIDGHIISLEREAALSALAALRHAMLIHIREKDQEIVNWKRSFKPAHLTPSQPGDFDGD